MANGHGTTNTGGSWHTTIAALFSAIGGTVFAVCVFLNWDVQKASQLVAVVASFGVICKVLADAYGLWRAADHGKVEKNAVKIEQVAVALDDANERVSVAAAAAGVPVPDVPKLSDSVKPQ